MRITLRLYRRHDIDLISLYKNPKFDFKKACVMALKGYVHKQPVFFKQPPYYAPKDEFKYGYQMFLVLDDNKDADIIDYLDTLRPRYRNEFIKMVIRGAIIGPIAYNCFPDELDAAGRDVILNNSTITLNEFPIKARKGKGEKRKNTTSAPKPKAKPIQQTKPDVTQNIPNIPDLSDIPIKVETGVKSETNITPIKEIEVSQPVTTQQEPVQSISQDQISSVQEPTFVVTEDPMPIETEIPNTADTEEAEEFDIFASLDNMFG